MPLAAPDAAPCVSSERWAEASKPVIVYCVSSRPSGITRNQNVIPEVDPSAKPELLIRSVKTKLNDWWVLGRTISRTTTMAAPATCHHTEMLLMIASRWLLKMLASAASTMIATNSTKIVFRPENSAHDELSVSRVRSRNVAAPYPTDAVTASRPIRFSQPVKKPAAGPPILAAHQ